MSMVEARFRAENEIAADAVWAMFASELLGKTPRNIAIAAHAAGITPNDIKRAEARRRGGTYRPPRALKVVPDPDPEVADLLLEVPAAPEPPPPEPRNAKERAKQPTRAYRMCNGPTHDPDEGALLLTGEFGWKNKRTGSRDSLCRGCRAVTATARRLEVRRLATLGLVLAFTLTEDDWVGGECCPRCRHRLQVGDSVVASASHLEHERCPA